VTRILSFESLHNHTIRSDGTQTYLEVLATAQDYGLGVIAFTDHDVLPDEAALQQLRDYNGPVKWTVGIELSCGLPTELGGAGGGSLHVLGLFTDPFNQALVDYCAVTEEGRVRRMRSYVTFLNSLGLKLTEEDCWRATTSRSIGSPHIVKAVLSYPENRVLIDQMVKRFEHDAGSDPRLATLYRQMMENEPKQYPYYLFMTRTSYIPYPRPEFDTLVGMDAAVKLIRDAGGVALLAHWFFNKDKLLAAELERIVEAGRLDGLETAVENDITQRDISADVAYLNQLAQQYNLLSMIGIDSHSPADFAAYARHGLAQESVGQTARLIERLRPNLTWSNLGL
jgi:3',5'-nucleoside bisphosphate phosphatase